MNIKEYNEIPGIEKMRMAVITFSYCSETFLQRYTVDELLKIHAAMLACEWDFLPESWSNRQVLEALNGIVPRWDDNETPIYT